MSNLPTNLLCGETQTAHFTFKNRGQDAMKNVYLVCSCPRSFAFKSCTGEKSRYQLKDNLITIEDINREFEGIVKVPLTDNKLLPGDEVKMEVSVHGALTPGVHEIDFLFYYEPFESVKNVPYRLIQQMVCIQTLSTLSISTSIQKSLCDGAENDGEGL